MGAWVADIGESRNTRWAAARIAEVVGEPCCVIVVSDQGTSCVIWVDKDIARADRRTGLWKDSVSKSSVGFPPRFPDLTG